MKRALIVMLFALHSSSLILRGTTLIPKSKKITPVVIEKPKKKIKKKKSKIIKDIQKTVPEAAPASPSVEPTETKKPLPKPKKEVKDVPKYVYYSSEVESLGSLALGAGHYKKEYGIMFRLGMKFRVPDMSLNMEFSSAYEFNSFGVGIIYEESVFEYKHDPMVANELGFIIETTGRHGRYFLKGNENYLGAGYRWDF